ncbi:MAG: hypothetical protein QXW32_06240 [Nitrososphaerales archaeon]
MASKGFDIGEALTSSFNILVKNPKILIPQFISSLIFTMGSSLSALALFTTPLGWLALAPATPILFLLGLIIYVIVSGMYPILVKDVVNGVSPSLASASKNAFRKIISLIAASILVSIIVAIGLILLVVPGLIFLTWFFYTIPALMLEDKGALEAMSASKSFGRNKKLNTLAVIIILGIFALIGGVFSIIPLIGSVISFLIGLFVAAWASVTQSYIYIKYATPPS